VLQVAALVHGVLEAEQHARVDLERQVEVDGTLAPLLRVEVDLPVLTQGVALDEVPLVVHVEPVLDGVVLEVGHEPRDVDDSHLSLVAPYSPAYPARCTIAPGELSGRSFLAAAPGSR